MSGLTWNRDPKTGNGMWDAIKYQSESSCHTVHTVISASSHVRSGALIHQTTWFRSLFLYFRPQRLYASSWRVLSSLKPLLAGNCSPRKTQWHQRVICEYYSRKASQLKFKPEGYEQNKPLHSSNRLTILFFFFSLWPLWLVMPFVDALLSGSHSSASFFLFPLSLSFSSSSPTREALTYPTDQLSLKTVCSWVTKRLFLTINARRESWEECGSLWDVQSCYFANNHSFCHMGCNSSQRNVREGEQTHRETMMQALRRGRKDGQCFI